MRIISRPLIFANLDCYTFQGSEICKQILTIACVRAAVDPTVVEQGNLQLQER